MIKTKVIATVGPACREEAVLEQLIAAGVDVFRFNMAHGRRGEDEEALARIRRCSQRTGQVIAVMADLAGRKIRLGPVGGDRLLSAGSQVCLQASASAERSDCLTLVPPDALAELQPGQRVFIDDGRVRLQVARRRGETVICDVVQGGPVRDQNGVNIPDTRLPTVSLTGKDRKDLKWAIDQQFDYLALSFVCTPEDIYEARFLLKQHDSDMRLVAKIERPQVLEHLDEVIEQSDAILVARGDLGVEVDLARVPVLQKDITLRCQRAGKPVIIATQMLQSMIENATPTRAEASDVANAVMDMTDAVLLSAETAVGKHPTESVQIINRLASEAEAFLGRVRRGQPAFVVSPTLRVTSTVAHAAGLMAAELSAQLVAVWTETGNTARLLSKHRLTQPIIGLTPHEVVCRRMCLHYGVLPVLMKPPEGFDKMIERLDTILLQRGLAQENDLIVVVTGTHLRRPGSTNTVLVHLVGTQDTRERS